jgi:hypothetical protein
VTKIYTLTDLKNLKDEIIFDSKFINSQQDVESELGYGEIVEAIMKQISIVKEEYF